MSLITSCPSCGTQFRVVADQLRISDGWVRCGRCQEVFDAEPALQLAPLATLASPSVHPDLPSPASVVHDASPTVPSDPFAPAPADALARADAEPDGAAEEAPAPVAVSADAGAAARPWPELPVRPTVDAPQDAAQQRGYELPSPPDAEEGDWAFEHLLHPLPTMAMPAVDAAPDMALPAVAPVLPAVTGAEWPPVPQPLPAAPLSPESAPTAGTERQEPVLDDVPWQLPVAALPAMSSITATGVLSSGAATSVEATESLVSAPGTEPPLPSPNVVVAATSVADEVATAHTQLHTQPPSPAFASAAPLPDFVRQAQRKAWWSRPAVRAVVGVLVVLLPVLLALQVAVQERNALAAMQPQLRPALEALCAPLGCTVGPRRWIGALVVSGSSFSEDAEPHHYRLGLSIQNRAHTAVAMPAVELTLNDTQGQILVRKVLQAAEIGAPETLDADSEWNGTLSVATQGLNLPVAGYRVLAFYP